MNKEESFKIAQSIQEVVTKYNYTSFKIDVVMNVNTGGNVSVIIDAK